MGDLSGMGVCVCAWCGGVCVRGVVGLCVWGVVVKHGYNSLYAIRNGGSHLKRKLAPDLRAS
jgi:hypothetical protein